eukprot:9478862-Pyramimonas_sp.AAC.2
MRATEQASRGAREEGSASDPARLGTHPRAQKRARSVIVLPLGSTSVIALPLGSTSVAVAGSSSHTRLVSHRTSLCERIENNPPRITEGRSESFSGRAA